ncbi:MAG: carotenoid oxygenase family protein, partial [Halobacteria archaeon]|nr:carotenoid oxygenase family protein [Halobacteria archaeon]
MTETPLPVEFDPETLETVGVFDYDDSVDGHLTTAHPHHDPERGVTVNYVTEFSRTSTYKLYTFDDTDADVDRDVVGTYDVDKPAYMHSFALTPNYAVLAEFPLVLSLRDLLLRSRPFIENYDWEPDRGTRFLVFDRSTGDVVAEPRADAFFAFHHVNAFETRDGDEVVLDVAAYPDSDVVDSFYLDTVLSDASEL